MPVKAVKRGHKWRVIESETGRLARNDSGTPVDGGGHNFSAKAKDQAAAVNRSLEKK